MGHHCYESYVKAYPYAKASSLDSALDDGIGRLLNMAKNQKFKEKKVLRITKDIFNY